MIGLAWYAPLGGGLILGAFVFALARVQQWRFSRRHDALTAADGAVVKVEHHHA